MVRKFKPPVRINVGKQRLLSTDTSSQAEFTRGVRQQIQGIVKNFEAFAEHMQAVTPEVLYNAFEPAFKDSLELVPRDTQALANSGYLETRRFRNKVVLEIGYAKGGNPHYGAFVHENLEVYHAEPTQAKFLQQPLEQRSDQIRDDIVNGLKETSGV